MLEKWTQKMVADRMEEAANTLKRLPSDRVKGYRTSWPAFLQEIVEANDQDGVVVRLGPPLPDAIKRMDECLDWLRWLEPEAIRLVWMRAEKLPWKLIMRQIGVSRDTAWNRWTVALTRIATRLDLLGEGKMSGHLSA